MKSVRLQAAGDVRPGPKPQRYEYVGTKYRRHRGKYFSCREWADIIGERATTVRYRVQADGGVIKDTDWKYQRRTRPVDYIYTGTRYPDLTGQRFTVREFADATGLSERAVRHRIEKAGGECIPDMRVYTRRSET